jgi:outer membrane protein TolC
MGALLVMAGCASTHGIKPQSSLASADNLSAERSLGEAQVDSGAWPAQNWWSRFGDPQLDQLIGEALAGSPSLQVALTRARQASALAAVRSRASAFQPTV